MQNLTEEEMIEHLKFYENKYGPYIKERGIKNWRNLFRKPTLLEYTILFMLVMGVFTAWAYAHDIKACNEFYNESSCIINQGGLGLGMPFLNITNITINTEVKQYYPNVTINDTLNNVNSTIFANTNDTFKEEILRNLKE